MKPGYCLAAIFLTATYMLAGCAATTSPATTQTIAIQEPVPGEELPVDLPTYFLPEQNPVFLNPGNLIGTVYISGKDRCFHRAECSRLGRTSTAVSRTQAKIQGYDACTVCKP